MSSNLFVVLGTSNLVFLITVKPIELVDRSSCQVAFIGNHQLHFKVTLLYFKMIVYVPSSTSSTKMFINV